MIFALPRIRISSRLSDNQTIKQQDKYEKKYIPLTATETGRVHELINEKLQTLFKSGDNAQETYDLCEELLALRAKFKVKM